MARTRKEIISRLKLLGLVTDTDIENLTLTFDDFLQGLSNEKDQLLKEILRIKEKKNKGQTLSFIEERLLEYIQEKFAY